MGFIPFNQPTGFKACGGQAHHSGDMSSVGRRVHRYPWGDPVMYGNHITQTRLLSLFYFVQPSDETDSVNGVNNRIANLV
jgi:hypothetical protein